MRTSVAINGFGRVGRATFALAYERGAGIDWVAINDLADANTLAHLLGATASTAPSQAPWRRRATRSSWTAM